MSERVKKNIYFIGIGGIGMSAIARYFHHCGYKVAGYDRVNTPLTDTLESEGISIHYSDNISLIESSFLSVDDTLVIYTPAIAFTHSELRYFIDNGFTVIKRSKALGVLSEGKKVVAVAGTHGKTSISTMAAWFGAKSLIMEDGTIGGGSAFLGGISKNIGSNLLLGKGDSLVVEADEFDRSFLQLFPDIAVVSSTDADHLDIYGDHNQLKESFAMFVGQTKRGGAIIYKKGIEIVLPNEGVDIYSYSLNDSSADFYAQNIYLGEDMLYSFDIVTPKGVIEGCKLGIPALINVENCVVAAATMILSGCDQNELRGAIESFRGVKRRFEVYINREDKLYIDDYAHHPTELSATLMSVKAIYGDKKITAIFQPHLYTRTRDFAEGFSASLSLADRVVLLPIYPAREEAIEGVCSEMLLDAITAKEKSVVSKDELLNVVKRDDNEIIITFGAGDIDRFCEKIVELFV